MSECFYKEIDSSIIEGNPKFGYEYRLARLVMSNLYSGLETDEGVELLDDNIIELINLSDDTGLIYCTVFHSGQVWLTSEPVGHDECIYEIEEEEGELKTYFLGSLSLFEIPDYTGEIVNLVPGTYVVSLEASEVTKDGHLIVSNVDVGIYDSY